jgi:hypothetical protein
VLEILGPARFMPNAIEYRSPMPTPATLRQPRAFKWYFHRSISDPSLLSAQKRPGIQLHVAARSRKINVHFYYFYQHFRADVRR